MDNIILGLLQLKARTIYEIRKRINDGLNLMYSCSTGSIQAALKKLMQKGFITVEEKTERGKAKKYYCITDSGKAYFDLWINSPMDEGAAKNPQLAKIYFLGFAEKDAREKLIKNQIAELKKMRADLEKICNDGKILSNEMQGNDIFYYQLQTAKYGRDLIIFNIEWYSRLLKEIKE